MQRIRQIAIILTICAVAAFFALNGQETTWMPEVEEPEVAASDPVVVSDEPKPVSEPETQPTREVGVDEVTQAREGSGPIRGVTGFGNDGESPDAVAAPAEEFIIEEPMIIVEEPDGTFPIVDDSYYTVDLFYATNRARNENVNEISPGEMFTSERNSDGRALTYGTAQVSIPINHQKGHLETPNWLVSLLFDPNPKSNVVLQDVGILPADAVMEMIQGQLNGGTTSLGRTVLGYVHGYNISFEEAARRAGQITYDLDFIGPSFFFSWPSQGSTVDYTHDSQNAEVSERHMITVLQELAALDADRVVLIAHSMGTRVLSKAIARLTFVDPEAAAKLSTIVLAAPDIDADTFVNDIAPRFRTLTNTDITMYASSTDTALRASKAVNGEVRIGDTSEGVHLIEGIDIIDATGAVSDFFGHTYFGDNVRIVDDIQLVVTDRLPTLARQGITVAPHAGGYWEILLD